MSEPNQDRGSAAEQRAQEAVRTLPEVRADAAFRARVQEAFTTGSFPGRRVVPLPWYRRGPVAWIAVPAAAAAALAAVLVLNQAPRWELIAVGGGGNIVVDGRAVPASHEVELRRALRGGARVIVPGDGELQLMNSDRMMILATAGTEFVIPAAPGRWFGRAVSASIERGTLRVSTRPGFTGSRLEVTTPEAAVEISGSTLAIICEATGTCVCVLDGGVVVGPRGGDMAPVPGGMRRYVFKDGRAPEMDEMRPMERVKLTDFREQASRVARSGSPQPRTDSAAWRLAALGSIPAAGEPAAPAGGAPFLR